jgi:hypothetical protein
MMVDDLMMMINDDWWLYPLVNKQFATENDAVEIEDFPIENGDFPAWKWPYNWNPPGSTREHGHRNSWFTFKNNVMFQSYAKLPEGTVINHH